MPRFARTQSRHDAALVTSYLRQLRSGGRPQKDAAVTVTARRPKAGTAASTPLNRAVTPAR